MKNFVESWADLKAKDYRHNDGTEVLSELDKESVMLKIKENLAIGIDPQEAARLAVQSHIDEVKGHLNEIYRQTGKTIASSREQSSPAQRERFLSPSR